MNTSHVFEVCWRKEITVCRVSGFNLIKILILVVREIELQKR